MSEQLTFLPEEVHKSSREKLLKRRWENGFQKWSDKNGMDGYTSLGACGYGSMCDYCEDNSYGRPCVRALNAMLREIGEKIDYENASFEDVWEGETCIYRQ